MTDDPTLRDELGAREERIRNAGARLAGRTPVEEGTPLHARLMRIAKDESRSDEDRAWALDIVAGREELGWPERNPVRKKSADGGDGTNYDSSVGASDTGSDRMNAMIRDEIALKQGRRQSGRLGRGER